MPRSTLALFLCVIAGALARQTKAQTCGANTQSPISTDRPQITSSSIVVPCGSLQFENGFQETGTGGQRTFDLPETSIRFGIANKTELRLGVPDYFFNDNTPSGFATGFGDLSLGFKQQLGPTRGGFNLSLIPSVSLPTGANAISSHGYDPTIQLPWSHSLSKNWTIAGMFSLMWPTEGSSRNLTGQSSAYFDRQLTAPWDAWSNTPAPSPNAEARKTSSTSAHPTNPPRTSNSISTAPSASPPQPPITPSASATLSAFRPFVPTEPPLQHDKA
jgi:hypothetical protein